MDGPVIRLEPLGSFPAACPGCGSERLKGEVAAYGPVETRPNGERVVKAIVRLERVVLVCANCGATRGAGP